MRKAGRGKSVGTAWIWAAVAPECRLTLAAQVGNRNLYAARRLLRAVRHCLAKDTWPLFTSDALRHYAHVLLEVFGVWQRPTPTGKPGRPKHPVRMPHPLLGYAQVEKRRKRGRVVDVSRSIVFGPEQDMLARAQGLRCANGRKGQINTAYVERQNLTLREENGRLSRKTLAFSKKRRELQHQLDFWRAYANFVRPHRSLRVLAPNGSGPRRWLPRTPAMVAGLSDHAWTMEALLKFRHWIYQPY